MPKWLHSPWKTQAPRQNCLLALPMANGEARQISQVPFPQGYLVAQIPGTKKPWTTLAKGGRLVCRFDEKGTDWKTKITGAYGRCQSGHCSVQFRVHFDCAPQQ